MNKEMYLQRYRREHPESAASDKRVLKSYYELKKNFLLSLAPEGQDRDGALLLRLTVPVDLSELEKSRPYEDYLHEAKVVGTVRVHGDKTEISPVFRLHRRDPGPHREESQRISTVNEPDFRFGNVDFLLKDEGFAVLMTMYAEENGEAVRKAAQQLAAKPSVRLEAQRRAELNEMRRTRSAPSSFTEALSRHFQQLSEKDLSEATDLLLATYDDWKPFWGQKTALAFACELHDSLENDSSVVAQEIQKVLDDYEPKFLHYKVNVTKELSEEVTDDWTYVEGKTSVYDENGNPCAEFPFTAKPGLHGEPVISCDWTARTFWSFDGYGRDEEPVWRKDTLSVKGYREAVDNFMKRRQPEMEAQIAEETLRFLDNQYFFGRDWYEEGDCLRRSIDEVVDLYAEKRSPEWTGIFKKSLEDSLNRELEKNWDTEEVLGKFRKALRIDDLKSQHLRQEDEKARDKEVGR